MKNKVLMMLSGQEVLEVYEEAVKRALKNGKKTGESIEEEFFEVMKEKKIAGTIIGSTDKDIDLLTGDLRESGFKVKNINEELRKQSVDDDEIFGDKK